MKIFCFLLSVILLVSAWRPFMPGDVDDADAAAEALAKIIELGDTQWRTVSAHAFATMADASWDAFGQQFERALHRDCERGKKGEIEGISSCGGVAHDGAAAKGCACVHLAYWKSTKTISSYLSAKQSGMGKFFGSLGWFPVNW
jgi:hypothetical protein